MRIVSAAANKPSGQKLLASTASQLFFLFFICLKQSRIWCYQQQECQLKLVIHYEDKQKIGGLDIFENFLAICSYHLVCIPFANYIDVKNACSPAVRLHCDLNAPNAEQYETTFAKYFMTVTKCNALAPTLPSLIRTAS